MWNKLTNCIIFDSIFFLKIDKLLMLIISKSISIISTLFLISRIIKNCKRFSFKYDFFVRF